MRKKVNLSKSRDYRPVLTEFLPFEVPPGFNSGGFFDFLQKTKPKLVASDVKKGKKYIEWSSETSQYDAAMAFVLQGIDDLNQVQSFSVNIDDGVTTNGRFRRVPGVSGRRRLKMKEYAGRNRAFSFDISHKEASFRRLSVPHPVNQFLASNFYSAYASEILYYSSISPFSIRKPDAIARLSYFNDLVHKKRIAHGVHFFEESHKEYDHLGSFFRYHRYSNVYRFYESKLYHNAEKKFDKLLKLDITRCFDSIYSHSISWAIFSKEVEKDAMTQSHTTTARTFASSFDKLMQNMNDGETNGIVIGPEISRIFTELILQRVDRDVETQLRDGSHGDKIFRKKDYEAFRYVDDYFLFYNSEAQAKKFCEMLEARLRDVKLSLSGEKQHTIEKPIITKETIAKNEIKRIFTDHLKPEQKEYEPTSENKIDYPDLKINANKLIVEFKTVIKSTDTTYSALLNFTLSNLEWRTAAWLTSHKRALITFKEAEVIDVPLKEAELSRNLQNLIEFSFFVFATTPKVNFSVRLTRLICIIVDEMHEIMTRLDAKESVLKSISDNLSWCLKKYSGLDSRRIEILYLLLANMKLGRYYRYNQEQLCHFLGAKIDASSGTVTFLDLDMFTADVCLLYIRRQARYSDIRRGLVDALAERFRGRQHDFQKDAELLIMFLDLATCPHLSSAEKEALSKAAGKRPTFMRDVGQCHTHWFIDWTGFDLTLELDKKRAREVY